MTDAAARASTPTALRRIGDGALAITWSDGSESRLPLREIRLACGCAVCCDETSGAPLLDPASVPDDIRAERIAPVGNYACTFTWSDGHSTGIYPWESLRRLADAAGLTEPPPPAGG